MRAETLLKLGIAYREYGDRSGALQAFETAIAVAKKVGDRRLQLQALIQTAVVYGTSSPEPAPSMRIALGERAIEPAREALVLARVVQDIDVKIVALQVLATVHSQLGQFELHAGDLSRAKFHFKEQLGAAQELQQLGASFPDRGTESEALWGLGMVDLKDHPKDAKEYFNRGLKAADSKGSWQRPIQLLNGLGTAHMGSGEPGRAEECYKRQLDLARQARDPKFEVDALLGLGVACLSQRKLTEAKDNLDAAVRIAAENGNEEQLDRILELLNKVQSAINKTPKVGNDIPESLSGWFKRLFKR